MNNNENYRYLLLCFSFLVAGPPSPARGVRANNGGATRVNTTGYYHGALQRGTRNGKPK
jgi:hypothetical protein